MVPFEGLASSVENLRGSLVGLVERLERTRGDVAALKALASQHQHDYTRDITGKPTASDVPAHSHTWASVTDKPATFTPSDHSHAYAASAHTHAYAALDHTHAGGGAHSHVWADLTDPPADYAPAAHTHAYATSGHTHDLSGYATSGHGHDLSGYALSGHNHSGTYATSGHSHAGYAADSHTHAGYAADSHTHTGFSSSTHTHTVEDLYYEPTSLGSPHSHFAHTATRTTSGPL